MITVEKIKVAVLAIATIVFAIISLREFSGHVKLAVGTFLASISAYTLSDWAAIVTILWGLLQIGLLIPDYFKMWKNRGNKPQVG